MPKKEGQNKTKHAEETKAPALSRIEQDMTGFIDELEKGTSELFAGQETFVRGDHLELLKLRVGSTILSDFKNVDTFASTMKPSLNKDAQDANFTIPKVEIIPEETKEEESSRLDQIISDLMGLSKPDFHMKNQIGLPSMMSSSMIDLNSANLHDTTSNGHTLEKREPQTTSTALLRAEDRDANSALQLFNPNQQRRMGAILIDKIKKIAKPTWHAPWKLKRVIAGHQGWVRCLDFDVTNEWFATGSTDRTIKFWDLASGKLKLSMTGHINTVRDVKISPTHTYLFSCSEDKTVRCWDLIQNKSIRNYHGHLSGVYTLAIHPTLNLLASGGRDSTVRLWDMRSKYQVHCLEGHTDTVHSIIMQDFEPQCVSGSSDATIRTWDIGTGKRIEVLTNHKKSVRSLLFHHSEYTFCSGGGDNLKVWKCPEAKYLRNFSGHKAIINSIALNEDNVLCSAADNGTMYMWDWKSGYNFQQITVPPQPGSISSEAGIFVAKFDKSSLRLVTGECDKTIKIWEEDDTATPQTHPIDPNFRSYMASKMT